MRPATRLAAGWRLPPPPPRRTGPLGGSGHDRLVARQPGWVHRPGKKGGGADQEVGPNPTDPGKAGSKRHILVDRQGIPLAVWLTAANVHDSVVFEDLIKAVEPIKRPRGRPRVRPDKLHADKGYDYPRCRNYLRHRGIGCRIARRGIESSDKLGRFRWVVERTFAWLNRFRRLTIRYERLADLHLAFLDLGCALICLRFLQHGF
jgi:IS5 family transposase